MLGLSQEKLGEAISLTFQQAVRRRLFDLAKALAAAATSSPPLKNHG